MSDIQVETLRQLQAIREDPIEFLKCVRTKDEVDAIAPVKPFPWELDYIQLYVRIWTKERFIAVPKSRRMLMTWTNLCLYTWDSWLHPGRLNAIVSKKEDDAGNLIEKCKFIIDNFDPPFSKDLLPKYDMKFCHLRFPQIDSEMRGFPQGADQLRQYTCSGIMADEIAFWEQAQQMYSASMPTLEGGGRFTAISSAAPGFFKRLVHDKLNEDYEDKRL